MNIDREKIIAKQARYCQHYNVQLRGVKACECGVIYDEQFPEKPTACWTDLGKTDEEQLARCPKWLRGTREQGEARADEIQRSLDQMALVSPLVIEWRNREPIGKRETVDCPVCQGRLHLSQSSYNGHVHGKCETKGCVSFME
jgi:hypothetical protein